MIPADIIPKVVSRVQALLFHALPARDLMLNPNFHNHPPSDHPGAHEVSEAVEVAPVLGVRFFFGHRVPELPQVFVISPGVHIQVVMEAVGNPQASELLGSYFLSDEGFLGKFQQELELISSVHD
jgi:hypothetical protein